MSSRIGLRFFLNSRNAFQNATARFRSQVLRNRRFQSTESTTQQQSFFQRSLNSPIGIKTVHFWAPVMKWVLVLAGLSDMARPAEKLSLTQNGALMCTGAIWTRWCLIIKPRNVLLATVNFFVGCLGFAQVTRIFLHRRSVDGSSTEALKDMTHDATDAAKAVVHKVEEVANK
ncbi:hypothetical protein FQN57_002409 [Myotisia sp. PD_48]|nr:hypothetical protein FQN57_002409 [Myotisia sp. PD_48]